MTVFPYIPGTNPSDALQALLQQHLQASQQPIGKTTPAPSEPPLPPISPPAPPPPKEELNITLRLECRPMIHTETNENGVDVKTVKYVLLWLNDDKTYCFGAVDRIIDNVLVDFKFSNTLYTDVQE